MSEFSALMQRNAAPIGVLVFGALQGAILIFISLLTDWMALCFMVGDINRISGIVQLILQEISGSDMIIVENAQFEGIFARPNRFIIVTAEKE